MTTSLRAISKAVGAGFDFDAHLERCGDEECCLAAANAIVQVLDRRPLSNAGLATALSVALLEISLRLASPPQRRELGSLVSAIGSKLIEVSEHDAVEVSVSGDGTLRVVAAAGGRVKTYKVVRVDADGGCRELFSVQLPEGSRLLSYEALPKAVGVYDAGEGRRERGHYIGIDRGDAPCR